MLHVHIITIFPEMFSSPFAESIIKRAQSSGAVKIEVHDLRQWTSDNHKTVDGKPFGGGPGMVMLVEPIHKAIESVKKELAGKNFKILLTSAKGETFSQKLAQEYTHLDALIIIAGHYEGVDNRVAEHIADNEISIGDYILTGGELPAMVITDAIVRLLPGVLGNDESLATESFNEENVLEEPQYTRPAEFTTKTGEVWKVPDILLSGNHAEIEKWRQSQKVQKG